MKAFLIVACIFVNSLAWGAFGDTTNGIHTSTAVTTQTAVFALAVSSGDALVCDVNWDNLTDTATVSDNINGSWTASVSATAAAFISQVFYFKNSGSASASGLTVTATIASTAAHIWLSCMRFTGRSTSAPLDGTPTIKVNASATAAASGTAYTSTGSSDDIFAFLATPSSVSAITAGSGYTVPAGSTNAREGAEYQAGVAAASYTANFTWTSNSNNVISTGGFTASGGAPATPCSMTTLGTGHC